MEQIGEMRQALLSHLNTQPTPRRSMLPSRQHNKQNKPINRSPLPPTRRSLCTKRERSQELPKNHPNSRIYLHNRPPLRHCQNHQEAEGKYHITTEGRNLFYCHKCAMKLKSQGFPIKKEEEPQNVLGNHLQYSGNPQFEVLKALLSDIYAMQGLFKEAELPQLEYEEIFTRKMEEQERLYDAIEQLVLRSREDSRTALIRLKEEWIGKVSHKGSVYASDMVPQEDLQIMRQDIEGNIESIISEVDEETFQQCVGNYKERLTTLQQVGKNKMAALCTLKATLSTLTDNDIDEFQAALNQLKCDGPKNSLGIRGSSCQQVVTSVGEEMGQVKGAFRNLFQPGRERNRSRPRVISRR